MRNIYQITTTYTKWLLNIPNDRKIDKMSNIYTNISLQSLPKLGFFGLKMYHLATLAPTLILAAKKTAFGMPFCCHVTSHETSPVFVACTAIRLRSST
jgi:hypothetical protein